LLAAIPVLAVLLSLLTITQITNAPTARADSAVGGAITRAEAIERARFWLGKGINYSQNATYPDPAGKTYRTDCSGYVSMALHMDTSGTWLDGGPNTGQLPESRYTRAISWDELLPGDILDNPGHGHTVLFAGWVSDTEFAYYSFGSTPVKFIARKSKNDASLDSHPMRDYDPLRYVNIIDAEPEVKERAAPVTGKNADGRMQVFAIGGNGALYSKWQTTPNGAWSDWKNLGGTHLQAIAVATNANGRMQVFAIGGNGQLYTMAQNQPNGDWGTWQSLGGQGLTRNISVTANADGRLQVFLIGGDGALYSRWQLTANGVWSDWKNHGGTDLQSITVDRNADGRLQVFAIGGNGALYSTWQLTANGNWGDWKSHGGTGLESIATGRNADGRLQVFAMGGNGALYSTWQLTANGNWADWNSMDGQDLTPRITTGSNADGRLQVFAVGGNGALYSRWQLTANGNWGDWNSFGGTDL
jgi:hypothetical protein